MSKTKKDRKTFYIDEKETQSIRAGGVLLYRIVDGRVDILLMNNKGCYEDLGGCTDDDDDDLYDTVSREVYEESNKKISKKSICKRIHTADYIYMPRSKYIIFILEATKDEAELTQYDFGTKEIHDNFERTIQWIPLDIFLSQDIIKYKLNFRLKNKQLFTKLRELNTGAKLTIRFV